MPTVHILLAEGTMNRSGSFRWFLRVALVIVLTTFVVLLGSPRMAPLSSGGSFRATAVTSGVTWNRVLPAGGLPAARQFYAMTYDPNLGVLVLFGGEDTNNLPLGDTWEFHDGSWFRVNAAISPSPRYDVGLVYDPTLGGLLLFGGANGGSLLNDTWLFTSSGWQELFPPTSPPPTGASSLAYDSTDGYALLVYPLPASSYVNVWTFSGTDWTNISASVGPVRPPDVWLDSSDDPASGEVLFYGGSQGCGIPSNGIGLTWTYAHGQFANVTGMQTLTPMNTMPSLAMAYDPTLSGVVMFSGYTINCEVTTTTYLYQAGHWANLTGVVGPPPPGRWNARLEFLPGFGDVLFSGNEAPSGGFNEFGDDTWVLGPVSTFAVTNFTAVPSVIALGQATTIYVGVVGGVGALTYTYFGLPSGCATVNFPTLMCVPARAGAYTIEVVVTDSTVASRYANTSLLVTAPGGGSISSGPGVDWVSVLPWAILVGLGGAGLYAFVLFQRRARPP
jgi:Galactose oxidase, central domain